MTTYFLDTNALVKLYAFDSTSYWTIGIVANKRPRHRIVVSDIVQVEVPSALYKLERVDPTVAAAQTDLAVKRFNRDLRAEDLFRRSRFSVVLRSAPLLARAAELLERYRSGKPKALHTLDALHLASALIARALLTKHDRATFHFVSADTQLRGCAADQGLAVIDPNHPPT
jgi:predicted nucleic acid-binding protein